MISMSTPQLGQLVMIPFVWCILDILSLKISLGWKTLGRKVSLMKYSSLSFKYFSKYLTAACIRHWKLRIAS